MTCRELVDFLAEYLAGELAPDVRARFEEHLGECPDCVTYLRTYQDAIRLGKASLCDPSGAAPEPMPEDLVKAILAARGENNPG